jgi:hypothetical protein
VASVSSTERHVSGLRVYQDRRDPSITSGLPTIRELPEKHHAPSLIHVEIGIVSLHSTEVNFLP